MTTNPDRQNVRELMDACRAHSDDLQLPELSALADAVRSDPTLDSQLKKGHRIDELIGQALREAGVPDGLEERLLAALANGEPRSEMLDPALDAELAEIGECAEIAERAEIGGADTSVRAVVPTPRSSRWRYWSLISVAAAITLLAICWSQFSQEPTFASQDDVASHTAEWLAGLSETKWSRDASPASHPLPGRLAVNTFSWQIVPVKGSSLSVVCYDVSATPSEKQYFFVCNNAHAATLPKSPPHDPALISTLPDPWSVGGWTCERPGFVYVLAIRGDQKRYQDVIGVDSKIAVDRRRQAWSPQNRT